MMQPTPIESPRYNEMYSTKSKYRYKNVWQDRKKKIMDRISQIEQKLNEYEIDVPSQTAMNSKMEFTNSVI